MISFFQEYTVPKLSQTSLYQKFNETSDLTNAVITEIKNAKNNSITPDKIPEVLALMKLNGDVIVKKAIKAYENGNIVILFNPTTSKIPPSLPYIVNGGKVYIFADKVVNNVSSSSEYTRLMATLEAAYLALGLTVKPDKIMLNRQLILNLCNLYSVMATAPLEQKLYVKGENLTKMMIYTISYFYRIVDGDQYDPESIVILSRRLILDKVDKSTVLQIANEVKDMQNPSFMNLIELIKQINPIRYKDIDTLYMTHFISVCGTPLIFGLENLSYLFMLVTSAQYKTGLTGYGLNKAVSGIVKKITTIMKTMFS